MAKSKADQAIEDAIAKIDFALALIAPRKETLGALEKELTEALANTSLIQTAEGRFLANLMLRFMETLREGKPVTPPASRHHA